MERRQDILKEAFNKIFLWTQVWNLSPQWISKDAGYKFKSVFSNIVDVFILERGSKNGRQLKVLAKIDLNKPLLRGTNIRHNGQVVWVDF